MTQGSAAHDIIDPKRGRPAPGHGAVFCTQILVFIFGVAAGLQKKDTFSAPKEYT